jgi:hypothetical protein
MIPDQDETIDFPGDRVRGTRVPLVYMAPHCARHCSDADAERYRLRRERPSYLAVNSGGRRIGMCCL